MNTEHTTRAVLHAACTAVGIPMDDAEVISLGENAIYRLGNGVVARISCPGQYTAAQREIAVSHWLESTHTPAARVIAGIDQPIEIDSHPVVFWQELPPHSISRPPTVARALRRLHTLPTPDIGLAELAPFVRLDQRIDAASSLTDSDRDWMRTHLDALRDRWSDGPSSCLRWSAIHGDAHEGNIVTSNTGEPIIIDLERFCIGPPEWDLTQTAVNYQTCGWIDHEQYAEFTNAYGFDVMESAAFELLRDIREFRMTAWLAQQAAERPHLHDQARHRVECLRGDHGQRPWTNWKPLY